MIPNNDWTHTYAGQMGIAVGLLILGFFAYLGVMGFIVARYKPPGRTQTNLLTGMTEQGIHWWGVRVALVTMGGQILFGIVRTLIEAVDRLTAVAPYWWIVAALVGAGIVAAVIARRMLRVPHRTYDHSPLPAPEPEPVQPSMGFTIDRDMPQWDQR
jgi:hypothetical protein